jgi:hypothetical protein
MFYLAEFAPDQTGTMRQVNTWHLTPENLETIRYALSFHLGYMEHTAAEVTETAGQEHSAVWLASALRDRRALRALSMARHDPDTTTTIDEEPAQEPAGFALKMLDQTGKGLILFVLLLTVVMIYHQIK